MTPEDRLLAAAVDRYWDALALNDRAPETDDLLRESAAQIDRLWALSTPPAADAARERVRRRLQLRDAETPADADVFGTMLDATRVPSGPTNGRISPLPTAVDHSAWRRGMMGWFSTAALLILVLVAGLFVMGPLRLPRPADVLVAVSDPGTSVLGAEPLAEFLWLATGGPNALFGEPIQPAIDAAGNVWVPDTARAHSRFLIFAPDGTFLETWGAPGSGEGEFAFSCSGVGLGGVAFDAAGNIYVADAGNQRVQKFGPDRALVSSWGSAGTADDQFLCPAAIAVDGQDRVYVADQGWGTIKVFTSDGVRLATWSGLTAPIGISVAGDNSIWVADADGGIVQFSAAGERLATWDASAVGDEAVNDPTGIAVDAEGRVYVTDAGANRVQVFAPDGTVLGGWGERGEAAGQFQEPRGVVLDGQGAVYVADFYGERVQKFRLLPPLAPGFPLQSTAERTPEGTARFVWAFAGGPDQLLGFADRMTLDPAGNLWMTDHVRDQFQILSPEGVFLETWGTPGAGEGEFDLVAGSNYNQGAVAFDRSGNIFVLDGGNRRIQKFAPDRSFLASWGSEGTGAGQFLSPMGIAVDHQGRVIVLDSQRHDLQVFDSNGAYQRAIGGYGSGEGEFGFGFGIGGAVSVAPDGTIWVADYNHNRIQQFAPNGAFLTAYGEYGTGEGQFLNPGSVVVDDQGRIYVADMGNQRIQVLTPEGAFLTAWGERGSGAGQFTAPMEVVLGGAGSAYVVDQENGRIQKFQLLPPLAP